MQLLCVLLSISNDGVVSILYGYLFKRSYGCHRRVSVAIKLYCCFDLSILVFILHGLETSSTEFPRHVEYRCRSLAVISSILHDDLSSLSVKLLDLFAIGQVCVHIKYVSTGKAYWLDATTFEWSDNGLDQMIDSLCKYVFAVASSTFLSSCLVFSKTPRNLQIGVMLFQALDRFKTPYLHILIRAEWRLQIKIFFFFLDLKISNRLWCIWVI